MSNKASVSIDFGWIAVVLVCICFTGEPDLIDAVIFKLTGVQNWVTP